VFTVHIEGLPPRAFREARVSIGRSTRCALVLPSPEVSRNHAVIEESDGAFTLEDCGSGHGTYVDGVRITKAAITRASQIRIGPFQLTIEPDAGVDLTEQRLLAAITSNQDAASRMVYADWLEQRGDGVRAEFLRLQESLAAVSPEQLMDETVLARTARLRELAASIDMEWRYEVARPAVEGCATRFNFKCPREWGAMDETERKDVRHCNACNKHVYYAATVEIARRHVEAGACVVVDIISRRTHGDLERRPVMMGGAMAPPPMPPGPPSQPRSWTPSSSSTVFLLYTGQRYPVTKDQFVIGGARSDLAIDGVPQPYATVLRRNGTFYIKDLGSTTDGINYRGLQIDNKRLDEGDVFYLGDHELRVTYRAE
jgi:uncharacterized protein (TIGR02996 family)